MDRVVSQLLAEMDGLNKTSDLFIIGATNRPDLLDTSLLRPGRFDRLLYVGIADDRESRLRVLQAQLNKFTLADDVVLEHLEAKCPPNLTGADFYYLCSSAMMNAIQRHVKLIQDHQIIEKDLKSLQVNQVDFEEALQNLRPSVSPQELARYESIKNRLQEPKVGEKSENIVNPVSHQKPDNNEKSKMSEKSESTEKPKISEKLESIEKPKNSKKSKSKKKSDTNEQKANNN